MIEQKDISRVIVVCDKINLISNRADVKLETNINLNIGVNWGIYAIRSDNRGVKTRVKYFFKSTVFEGDIEVTILTDFNREIVQEELKLIDAQKFLASASSTYIIPWIADISSKMGMSPIVLDTKVITDLFKPAK